MVRKEKAASTSLAADAARNKRVIAAFEKACKKSQVPWPIQGPRNAGRMKPEAWDTAYMMEIHAVINTALTWDALHEMAMAVSGDNKFPRTDRTKTAWEVTKWVQFALGLDASYDGGPVNFPDRDNVLKLWQVSQTTTGESSMATKGTGKATGSKAAKEVTKKVSKSPFKTDKEMAKPKAPKAAPAPKILPLGTIGGLELGSAFLDALADYSEEAATETDDPRVAELAIKLRDAAKLLTKIVG